MNKKTQNVSQTVKVNVKKNFTGRGTILSTSLTLEGDYPLYLYLNPSNLPMALLVFQSMVAARRECIRVLVSTHTLNTDPL